MKNSQRIQKYPNHDLERPLLIALHKTFHLRVTWIFINKFRPALSTGMYVGHKWFYTFSEHRFNMRVLSAYRALFPFDSTGFFLTIVGGPIGLFVVKSERTSTADCNWTEELCTYRYEDKSRGWRLAHQHSICIHGSGLNVPYDTKRTEQWAVQ